jgi:hypothetical protein
LPVIIFGTGDQSDRYPHPSDTFLFSSRRRNGRSVRSHLLLGFAFGGELLFSRRQPAALVQDLDKSGTLLRIGLRLGKLHTYRRGCTATGGRLLVEPRKEQHRA